MESKVNLLLAQLKKVTPKGKGQWMACCPAHEDRSPSLAIKENHDGRILVKCFAGCGASDVVHAVGLQLSDLFPDGGSESFNPFAFARYEKRQAEQQSNTLATEKLVLDMAQAKRERGEKLTPQDLERERKAFYVLRSAGVSV